ncbi:cytochrome c [Geomonas sp. Red276]
MKHTVAIALTVGALIGAAGAALAADSVSLPRGYEKWAKSKARVEPDRKSMFYGIHYIYVDKKAMKGYKTGGPYPEGSQFVAVNYSIKNEGGKQLPGKRTMIVVMKKDKKQTASGGWQFAGFSPDGKPSGLDPVRDCFGCHEKDAKERNFVISTYADFK